MATSTWGDPSAHKRVLLVHGITSSSLVWHRVAQDLASRGKHDICYFITAPDLLGHGRARRGSDYSIAALVDDLRPFLTAQTAGNDHPYHIVIGHSLGGVVVSAMLPLLASAHPVRVVLVDPPLEQSHESALIHKQIFCAMVTNPMTPEAYLEEHPLSTKEEAVLECMSLHLCDANAVEAIIDQNSPWSFWHNLSTVPENVNVIVLAADPSKGALVTEEDLKPYPHIATRTAWGASHLIPFEFPQVVVQAALEGVESHN